MNSFVSVEEQDVSCDEFDGFVFSASNISGTSFDSDRKSDKETNFSNNALLNSSSDNSSSLVAENLVLCMAQDKVGLSSPNRLCEYRPTENNFGPNLEGKLDCDSGIQIDSNLIPLEITGTYNDSNAVVDIDCLPFESVLMNYPDGCEYLTLNENINSTTSLFDSDLEEESFDGFSDKSNSSFEGFFRGQPAKSNTARPTESVRNRPATRRSSVLDKSEDLNKKITRDRRSSYRPSSLDSVSKDVIKKVEGNKYIREISSSFGKYQVKYPAERKSPELRTSTPVNKSLESRQNYSKSPITPVYPSASQEFKKEANASRAAMQQKGKKEGLRSSLDKTNQSNSLDKTNQSNSLDFDSLKSKIDKIVFESTRALKKDLFNCSDTSDHESFEGFETEGSSEGEEREQEHRPASKIDINPDDSIGKNCDDIGCTISWLETGSAKSRPVEIRNVVVFELSEFAKRIAWESCYIAEWIFRLKGYTDLKVQNEDMKKITTVIKRRKALLVNMAGQQVLLKSKISAFDDELFILPTIEKLQNEKNSEKLKIKKENISEQSKSLIVENNFSSRKYSISESKSTDKKYLTPQNRLSIKRESKSGPTPQTRLSNRPTSQNKYKNKKDTYQNKVLDKKALSQNEFSSQTSQTKNDSKLTEKSTRKPIQSKRIFEDNSSSENGDKESALTKNVSSTLQIDPILISDEENEAPISDIDMSMNSEDNIIISSENEASDTEDLGMTNLLKGEEKKTIKDNSEKVLSSRGRVKKPTVKARESYDALNESDEELYSSEIEISDDDEDDSFSVTKNKGSKKSYLNNESKISNKVKLEKAKEPFVQTNSSSEDDLIVSSDNEASNEDIRQMAEENTRYVSQNSETKLTSKGRFRKPTVKAQESCSQKLNIGGNDQGMDTKDKEATPTEIYKPKLLHPIFKDGKSIGPYCETNCVDIKLLNSSNKANCLITNGIIYELYHFFRERKASLTSLVHTVYRLKNTPMDKSHIIATMAKIHEMVKVMWVERLSKNKDMPNEEFCLPEPQSKSKILKSPNTSNISPSITRNENEENSTPLNKRRRLSSSPVAKPIPSENLKTTSISSENLKTASISSESNSSANEDTNDSSSAHSKHSDSNLQKDSGPMTKTFDLNSTKGYVGKITRGDIVYLYTKWLKKKMEGQTNVFVTDLSKDVEDLILERQVEFIRIPVGTLMSSSVKLFEEFRKLSKSDMLVAKTYLLENWIEDIKCILSFLDKKISDYNSEDNQENVNVPLIKPSGVKEPLPTLAIKEDVYKSSPKDIEKSEIPKPIIKDITDEYDVEKIVGYRIVKIGDESVTEYRIRWSGFTSKDDSWINESGLNCPTILAKFWDALNKQRALKAKTISMTSPVLRESKTSSPKSLIQENFKSKPESMNLLVASVLKETQRPSQKTLIQGQENVSPFFGRDIAGSSQKFFNLMIRSLKPDLIDYQHEEEKSYMKRVKVSKGEVLNIYDKWRHENQEHLLTGGNQKVDVNMLISRVKELMELKRVRNFNPNCILDVCYRMSLMKAKLKDKKKVEEYLCGDFMDLMQVSQKHQDFVRRENASCLKNLKQDKLLSLSTEEIKLKDKIDSLNNGIKESLIISQFIRDSKTIDNIEKTLEREIYSMRKVLNVEKNETSAIEGLKKQNSSAGTIKELESLGVNEDTLDEILTIALKIN